MTEIPFRDAPFQTSVGTAAITLNDRFRDDAINVAEFADLNTTGTFGTQTGDDAPCFQRALDYAFHNYGGDPDSNDPPTGVPHGLTYKHLNRPVFIPNGRYFIGEPLLLKQIVGGHIRGASASSSMLKYGGSVPESSLVGIFLIDGAADLTMEHLYLENIAPGNTEVLLTGSNTCVIDLNWTDDDGPNGSDGLHDCHFRSIRFGGGEWNVIVADAGNGGAGMLFEDTPFTGGVYGLDIRGPDASCGLFGGGGNGFQAIVRCPAGGGSAHVQAFSNGGHGGSSVDADYVMESDGVMTITGGRVESFWNILRQESGVVTMQGVTNATAQDKFAEINGGKCTIQGCFIGSSTATEIVGTGGELYLIGGNHAASTTPLSGYTGTIRVDFDALSGSIIP